MPFLNYASGALCAAALFLSPNIAKASSPKTVPNAGQASVDIFSSHDGEKAIFGTGVFAPLFHHDGSLLYLDTSVSAGDNSFHAASLGVGYRIQKSWGVLGLNGFFDVGETLYSGVQQQLGLGAELATGRFRLGINAYLPLNRMESAAEAIGVRIVGDELRIFAGQEHFLKGADLEFGLLASQLSTDTLSAEVWANGKLESFRSDVLGTQHQALFGLEAIVRPVGLTGLSGSTLKLHAGAQWDSETGDTALVAGFNVNMALNTIGEGVESSGYAEANVMSNRVRRRHGIKTAAAASGSSELTFDDETDVALNTVYQPVDQASLDLAVTNSDALVIVEDPGSLFGPITIGSDITVMGGGSTILVRGQQSGHLAAFTASGSQPHFYNGMFGSGSVINVSNNSSGVHVAGLDILGNGGNSLFFARSGVGIGTGVSNIVVENNRINDTTVGISQGPFGGDVTIRNNYIDTAVLGLNLGSNLTGVLIEGNTIGNLRFAPSNNFG